MFTLKKKTVNKCGRCNEEGYYFEPCMFCKRAVCRPCMKSTATASKTERRIICKDCWGDKRKQKAYQRPV